MTTPERPAKCYQNRRPNFVFILCQLKRARGIILDMKGLSTPPLESAKPDPMLGGGGLALRMKEVNGLTGGRAVLVSPWCCNVPCLCGKRAGEGANT